MPILFCMHTGVQRKYVSRNIQTYGRSAQEQGKGFSSAELKKLGGQAMSRKGMYRRVLIMILIAGLALLFYYAKINIDSRLPKVSLSDYMDNYVKEGKNNGNLDIQVDIGKQKEVYACGFPIGVYLETDGVMVIGTGTIIGTDGLTYEPSISKIQSGDYIVAINDIDVSSKSQLIFLINKYGNKDVILTVRRNDKLIDIRISPIQVSEGEYKLGIWVRDDSQGIGTMTFITSDGEFGALGHGISDVDTGELLNAAGGTLYGASIWGIKKGESGVPGGLYGVISYEDKNILGEIKVNTSIGIYGNIDGKELIEKFNLKPVEVAGRYDIHVGKAYVRTCVSGEVKDYEIYIESIDTECESNKGIVIQVTDKELLKLTNGIVQGMSGSPILQDGKLIGAVTHVFVKDSTRGYGIFIENMLEH